MSRPLPPEFRVKVHGYCGADEGALLRAVREEGIQALRHLPGQYVLVVEGLSESEADDVWLVSSNSGVVNYYYTSSGDAFVHGDTVSSVFMASRLPWKWNWVALADVLLLEHTLEDETLHADIRRLPPACVLHWHRGHLELATDSWAERFAEGATSPGEALAVFNGEVGRWAGKSPAISLSGGFDSRVILAALLRQGHRPSCVTLGTDESTDVAISRDIARSFSLEWRQVTVEPEEYLIHGGEIARLTGGTKTAQNWHTYIYPRKGGLAPSTSFFVGSNGEFARTFFLDYGLAAQCADAFPGRGATAAFWRRKLRRLLSPEELSGCEPGFAEEFSEDGLRRRLSRLTRLSQPSLLKGLDRFYLEQRVSHFIGNGLALYGATVQWRTPFLSDEWARLAWRLPRRWKLGSAWHRLAIAQNEARLLQFQEPGTGRSMSPAARPLYWAGLWPETPVVGYAHYAEWFAKGPLHDYLRANLATLAAVIAPETQGHILEEHRDHPSRTRVLSFLLGLNHWVQHLTSVPRGPESGSREKIDVPP